ncbi:MAG: F0F1 ATP synthase subunit B [Gemmataceae bacterium]
MLRRNFVLTVLVLLLVHAISGLAFSAAPAAAEGQKDIFGFAVDTGVWTLVLFVLLFLVMKKLAWGPMLEGLQKREENIRKAIDEADAARQKAQSLQSELDAKLRAAGDQVRQLVEEARRDGQAVRDEMLAKAKLEISAERERLQREIQLAKDQALKELLTKSADLALLISSKAVKKSLTIDDHRSLVDDCVKELSSHDKGIQFTGAR